MSELFNVALSTINYHLTQIDESGEVQLSTAIRKIRIPSDNCPVMDLLTQCERGLTLRLNGSSVTTSRRWRRAASKNVRYARRCRTLLNQSNETDRGRSCDYSQGRQDIRHSAGIW